MPDSVQDRTVCLVSLGCSKNLVDSEVMAGHLGRAGLQLVSDPDEADLVVVNTCGFIDAAREESIDTILEHVARKKKGRLKGLVVSGCLVELHAAELAKQIPEVDAFLPLSDYSGVPSIVQAVLGGSLSPGGACPSAEGGDVPGVSLTGDLAPTRELRPGGLRKGPDDDLGRALLTPRHTAYLRLGEGCNHVCAFCAIPKIRGKLRSKPLEVLVEEAHALAALGTRELTLVAEDTTDWGKDLGGRQRLADLLRALGEVEGIRWVRVMYAHPATMDDDLAATMAAVPNVVPYLDIPVQHGDAEVLRRMRRGTSPERIRDLVRRLREAIPGITLRTTILTGFPGETEARFGRLLEMLEELRFDRVGCFVFSPESTTEAFTLRGRPSRKAAERRREAVMRLQRDVLQASNKARVGGVEEVLVDAVGELPGARGIWAAARSVREAPEVDGQILVALPDADAATPGDFVQVRMTGVQGYDMMATLAR
ncbi:MAG: 30S ribosomal protein S12 methylthiotransferase RimO [Planctomycetes bacterium]|nr:30S ribosomal protein S12 methylthiotransferase RimO [Planctomycetota bacterium]